MDILKTYFVIYYFPIVRAAYIPGLDSFTTSHRALLRQTKLFIDVCNIVKYNCNLYDMYKVQQLTFVHLDLIHIYL